MGGVFSLEGVSPTILSGQGVNGRGIGSCNAPKIIEFQYEGVQDVSVPKRG